MRTLIVLALAGCSAAIGPTAGIQMSGPRSGTWVFGGEATGGLVFGQLAAGFSGDRLYGRADATLEIAGSNGGERPTSGLAARLGAGVGGGQSGSGGVAALGLGYQSMIGEPSNTCGHKVAVGTFTLEVRYMAGWQVVMAPRIGAHFGDPCVH